MKRPKFNPFDLSKKADVVTPPPAAPASETTAVRPPPNHTPEGTVFMTKASVQPKPAATLAENTSPKAQVRPELIAPIQVLLSRCEMFLERAKTVNKPDLAFDLQKIISSTRYLSSLITGSNAIRDAVLEFNLGELSGLEVGSDKRLTLMAAPDKPDAQTGHVLLIDDDPALLETLKFYLEAHGHLVTTARGGKEGLSCLHNGEFDLIVVDLFMPEVDGYQVLSTVKGRLNWRDIPVIIFSGMRESANASRCLEMGAADYLLKPIDPVLLRTRIGACLSQRKFEAGTATTAVNGAAAAPPAAPAPVPRATQLAVSITGVALAAIQTTPEGFTKAITEMIQAVEQSGHAPIFTPRPTEDEIRVPLGLLAGPPEDNLETVADLTLGLQQTAAHVNEVHGTHLQVKIVFEVGGE